MHFNFDHLAITVSDLEKSVGFYRDILGFRVLGKLIQDNGNFVIVYLDMGDKILELFNFTEKGKYLTTQNDKDMGIKHFAFKVKSVDQTFKYLREKGGAKTPEEVVKFLLEKRHVAPSHGATLYIPDSQNDTLVIRKMPDFFICGHTHKLSLANYKGCTIVSCGCWVEMSDYQEKMGMYPDVGKTVIVNTKTRKPHILNFYTEKYKQEQKNNQ